MYETRNMEKRYAIFKNRLIRRFKTIWVMATVCRYYQEKIKYMKEMWNYEAKLSISP